jgi:hypothetical protein
MPHGQVLATMYSTDMHHDTDISGGVVFICMQLHLGKAKFNAAGGDLRSIDFNRPKNLYRITYEEKYIMESLFRLFPEVENDQVQIASTASFFMTCGHGSPPKISGETVTVHVL